MTPQGMNNPRNELTALIDTGPTHLSLSIVSQALTERSRGFW